MKHKGITMVIAAALCLVFFAASGFAKSQSGEKQGEQVSVTGKIEYQKRIGGYLVQAENPPTQLFIVNPNKKILEKLIKSGKPVKIEGRLTVGADHLKIEKINGRQYP